MLKEMLQKIWNLFDNVSEYEWQENEDGSYTLVPDNDSEKSNCVYGVENAVLGDEQSLDPRYNTQGDCADTNGEVSR